MKSCDFDDDQFGKVWSISLDFGHPILFYCFHMASENPNEPSFQKPLSPEPQGHCSYKRHAKGSMAQPQHCSLHILLLVTTEMLGTSASAKP